MERPQRPQRPQAPQRPMNNMQGQQMQNQQYPNQQFNPQYQNQQYQNQQYQNPNQQNINLAKKKKSPVKVILIGLGVVIGVSLIGYLGYLGVTGRISSRVTDLESEVARLEQTIQANNAAHQQEVAQLNEAIADTTVKEVVPTTSLQRVEASQVPELWLIEGDFIAPNLLELPFTSTSVNDSYMQIGQKFVFRPSDRWIITSQGATYEFGHPQKIWGKIRALSSSDTIPQDSMQKLISDFFVGYPATEITYNKFFIDDRIVGMRGSAPITVKYTVDENSIVDVPVEQEVEVPYETTEEYTEEVPVMQTVTNADGTTSEVQVMETITNADGTTTEVPKVQTVTKTRPVTKYEKKTVTVMQPQTQTNATEVEKEMIVNVGFVQRSDYALSFIFVYDAEGGSNSQELIDLLLRSGTFGANGSSLKLE